MNTSQLSQIFIIGLVSSITLVVSTVNATGTCQKRNRDTLPYTICPNSTIQENCEGVCRKNGLLLPCSDPYQAQQDTPYSLYGVCRRLESTLESTQTGTVTRPVECRDQNGNTVADTFCTDPKPATSQIQTCVSTNTYSWSGARSTCQATLSCQTFISSLAGEGTCPQLTSATCASNPICMMQSYGTGNQTRDNICRDQNGNPVADALCPQPEPPTLQTCDGYARYTSDRSVCTNGTQTRTLTCKNTNGNIVADTLCPQPEPATSQACVEGQTCQPKRFPVRKVDREGNIFEWQSNEVYIRGNSGNYSNVTIPITQGAGLTNRLNTIIGAQIAYRTYNTSNGYNPNAYGECVGDYIGAGGSPLPEDIYAACGHLDTSTSTNAPNYYIRDHERNFSNGNYTLYTIYGTGRYEITADSTLLYSYVAVPGETATGPAREVTSIRLVGEYNAQVITDLNDPYSERAPIVYNDQTSAPWLGNYPSGDPQCTTRATESTCTQSERCSRVPDGAVCGTSSQPRYSVPGDINTVNTNGLCSVGIVGNDDAQSYLLYNNEYRAWECIDPNGGATAYCCANGTTAGECESYGY